MEPPRSFRPVARLARLGDFHRLQDTLHAIVPAVVEAVLDYIDLDAIIARVDIDAIAARLDLEPIIERIDLPARARQVIDDIDLPEIIRESTGAVTSEAVVGLRMQGIAADDGVARIVDRLLLRRGARSAGARTPLEAGDETAR